VLALQIHVFADTNLILAKNIGLYYRPLVQVVVFLMKNTDRASKRRADELFSLGFKDRRSSNLKSLQGGVQQIKMHFCGKTTTTNCPGKSPDSS
jgi:hypothetical protein